jgi:hypothetical protein
MKSNLNRIERMCIVIEIAVEKMLIASTNEIRMAYMYRYNLWWGMLEKELDSNTKIEVHMLKVSFYMECLITGYITTGQEYEIAQRNRVYFKSTPKTETKLPIDWWVNSMAK